MTTINYNEWQAEPGHLGKRETKYFLGFVQGLTDKQVARDCGVSHHTVAGARKRILYKLNAMRMQEAVAKAVWQGMVKHLCIALCTATVLALASVGADSQPIHRGRGRTSTASYRRIEETYVAVA